MGSARRNAIATALSVVISISASIHVSLITLVARAVHH
jgi:hypothetical protein